MKTVNPMTAIASFHHVTTLKPAQTLVVFDSRVQDLDVLYRALVGDAVGYTLSPTDDAISTITRLLSDSGAKNLAIVAHGEPGVIHLGANPVNLAEIDRYAGLLQEWCVDAISIYSCEVGIDAGFVVRLGELTGARVAATSGKVGSTVNGGSWEINDYNAVFASDLLQNYQGVLAAPIFQFPLPINLFETSGNDTFSTVTGTLTATDADSDPLTYGIAGGTNNGNGTVSLTNNFGSLTVNTSTGAYTFVPSDAGIEALKSPTAEAFQVTVTDGITAVTRDLVINIATSANDPAAIAGNTTGTVSEAGGANNGTPGTSPITGTLTSTDLDDPANTFTASSGNVTHGSYAITNAGVWTYTLDNNSATVQALDPGDTLTDSFVVTSVDGTSQTVAITINGANDFPVITSNAADASGTVVEAGGVSNNIAGTPTISGNLANTDADGDDPEDVWTAANGNGVSGYGTYTVDAVGAWIYTLNNDNTTVQGLNVGQTLTDTFVVAAEDGVTQTVTVTIQGANDAAVISGTASGTVVEAGGANNGALGTSPITGTLTLTDLDNPANTFTPSSGNVTHGSYAITNAGVWTYTLNNNSVDVQALDPGDTLSDSFAVTSADGTSQTVSITINGANDFPVITSDTAAASGIVVEAGGVSNNIGGTATISGNLANTDADGDDPEDVWTAGSGNGANSYGTYTVDAAGAWSYTLNNDNAAVQGLNVGQTLTDTFVVAAEDGVTQTVTVTIQGANDAAVISGTTSGTVVEAGGANNGTPGTSPLTGTLTLTDLDNPANTFTVSSGAATHGSYAITNAGVWTYTLNNNSATVQALDPTDTLNDSFVVAAADGTSQTVTITINGANDFPVITSNAADASGIVVEAGGVSNANGGTTTISGNLANTDADDNDPEDVWTAGSGNGANSYGTYTVDAAGAWSYTLNNDNAAVQGLNVGQTLTDTFVVAAEDGVTQTVTVTIQGANDAPFINFSQSFNNNSTGIIDGTIFGDIEVKASGADGLATPDASGYAILTEERGASPRIHAWGRACRGFSRREAMPRL